MKRKKGQEESRDRMKEEIKKRTDRKKVVWNERKDKRKKRQEESRDGLKEEMKERRDRKKVEMG